MRDVCHGYGASGGESWRPGCGRAKMGVFGVHKLRFLWSFTKVSRGVNILFDSIEVVYIDEYINVL